MASDQNNKLNKDLGTDSRRRLERCYYEITKQKYIPVFIYASIYVEKLTTDKVDIRTLHGNRVNNKHNR
jgi:hypothetical protein